MASGDRRIESGVTIRFGWEPLRQALAEPNFRDMARAYHNELWGDTGVPCEPDWERRQKMEDQFVYRLWIARVDETMAGFIEFQVMPTINAKSTLFALDAGHFISPPFRDIPRLGWRMWRTATSALQELGVSAILAHDNIKHPLAPFFIGLGFKPIGVLYHKVLTP